MKANNAPTPAAMENLVLPAALIGAVVDVALGVAVAVVELGTDVVAFLGAVTVALAPRPPTMLVLFARYTRLGRNA